MTAEHRFGQIAVQQQFITADQLQRALDEQGRLNMRIGDLLVQMGFISKAQSTAIAKFQHVLVNKLNNDDKLIGEILGGACLILEEIGQGAVGITYKAHHLNLDREVAIKVLTEQALGDRIVVERFRREARAIARLSHPSIIGVYDFKDEEDFPYLVMEYVEGKSLRQLLDEQGCLPLKGVVWTALKLATALAAAHTKKVVHRDLKPENVLISKNRDVKLADFGLTRLDGDISALSDPGGLYGTPQYMAPEQAKGLDDVDHRVDYYSLGIMLFELLTGRLPYTQAQTLQLLRAQTSEPLPDIIEIVPNCPPDLAAVINELAHKDRDARLTDTAILTARLHDIVSHWSSVPTMFPGVTKRFSRPGENSSRLVKLQVTDSVFLEQVFHRSVDSDGPAALRELIYRDLPKSSEIAFRVADDLWTQGRADDIVSMHSELQVGAKTDERVLIIVGLAYRKNRRLHEALTCLRTACLMNRKSHRAVFEFARTLIAMGRRDDVPGVIHEMLIEHAEDPEVLERAGEFFHMELGNDDLAMEAYQRALELKTETWALLQRMGWIELERNNALSAVPYLEEAVKLTPQPAFSLKLLARAYHELHRIQDAQDCLKHSLQLDPSDIDTRMGLIQTLKFQGQYKEVLKLCKQGLQDHPGDLQLSLERGETLLLNGDHERAAKIFRRVLRSRNDNERAKTGLISAQRARQQSR
ncbi:MAG: protein kinase [Planctomycetota bacterium]|nr:protein kinase [Planctomycetota bacterium]